MTLDLFTITKKNNFLYNFKYKLLIIDNYLYNSYLQNRRFGRELPIKRLNFYDYKNYFIYENKLHLLLLPMQVKESNSETFHTALLCIEFPERTHE